MGKVFGGGYFAKGYLAVEFFFIVTGIMMCQTAEKSNLNQNILNDTFHFIKKKIFSLMPNYYIAWIITLIVVVFCQLDGNFEFSYLMDSYGELFFLRSVGIIGFYSNNPTWYISVMLTAELLLYPLLRKWRDNFYIFAPSAFLLIMGIFNHYWGRLNVEEYFGICSTVLLRAIMGILLGSICYKVAQKLKECRLREGISFFASIIALGIYILVLVFMVRPIGSYDLLIVIMLGVSVTLTYSEMGIWAKLRNFKIFNWLAELSLNLYLSHYAIMKISTFMASNGMKRGKFYIIGSFINALLIMYLSKFLRKLCKGICHRYLVNH